MTLREKIQQDLAASVLTLKPQEKGNTGRTIWPIFYWQVVEDIASKGLKQAWEAAATEGVVNSDDQLRALGEGEHLVVDSNHFSVLASVSKPRLNFDRDLFLDKVAKKYKLDKAKLMVLAESCKVEGKAALSKRVVEAAQ